MDIQNVKNEIEKVLGDVSFPAHKDDVVQKAEEHGVSNDTQQSLKALPSETFNSAGDLLSKLPFASELEDLGTKFL